MPYVPVCSVETLPAPRADGTFEHPAPSEEQYLQFYSLMGATVATWQLVESSILWIYLRSIEARNFDGASAAWLDVVAFRSRLSMTDKAVGRSRLAAETRSKWDALSTSIGRAAKQRNALAHGTVYFQPARENPEEQLFVAPTPGNPDRLVPDLNTNSSNGLTTWRKLAEMQSAFMALKVSLEGYHLLITKELSV